MKKTTRILFILVALMALALAGTGCTAKAKKAYHLSRADRYYADSELGKAEIEYLNVLRYDPANPQAYGRLGQIYYDQGRLQRALFFLAKGSQMTPDNLDLRLKLGFIYSSVGQFTQTVAEANFILEKKPQDDEAPIMLVEGSVKPKDAEAARQRLQGMARNGDRAATEVALGNLALRGGDTATASADYKKAQALDPKSPQVNAALAAAAWAQGDLKQAEAFFKAAADASPPRSLRRTQYIRFKVQTGDIAGARALLLDVFKATPDYLPAPMMLAEIAMAEKKYDECASWLDKVLALDPDDFDALYFQGQLDLARGESDKAVVDMEKMERAYPQVPQVHYQLATAYLAAHDPARAIDSLNRALELNPNFVEATLSLAEIQIQNRNPEPVIISLEKVRQKMPQLVPPQLLLADAYRMQKRVNDAIAIYTALETTYPTNAQVRLLHGAALIQSGDAVAGRKALYQVLKLSPGNVPALEQLVDLDIAETNYNAGMTMLDGEIQREPKQIGLHIIQAKLFLAEANRAQTEAQAQAQRVQAEDTLAQGLAVDPDNLNANLLLGQIYSDTGETEKALAKVNAVMAKDPKNILALMLMAKIYEINKDYRHAADAYEKVVKIDPKYSPAYNNAAYLYLEFLNNVDRAYELAQHARDLLPFEPSTADTLGWACFKKGSYQSALALEQESATKLGAVPEIQFHLGMASYMTASETAARASLQWAWQNGTNFPERDECARSLSVLEVNPATADAAAQTMLEKRVSEKADDPIALNRLARIYQRQGNASKAITAYEALLQAIPDSLDAMTNLTRLYATKDPQKAYEMAKGASKLAPYDSEVSHTLGRLAFQSGDYHLAASVLQQSVQKQPDDASVLFDYACAAYSVGMVSQAQAAWQNALAANLPAAQAGQARRNLDMLALAATPAQAAGATARIADVLKSEPDDVPALMARAVASESSSDRAAAEQAGEKVLVHYPDFTPAQKLLAELYVAEPAKQDRAYALASKVHDALPDDPEGAKILGIALFQHADYSHAASVLKQSVQKLNSDPEAFYYLGNAQFHLKNRTDSKANLQQALALKLSGPLAEAAKQMLNELK